MKVSHKLTWCWAAVLQLVAFLLFLNPSLSFGYNFLYIHSTSGTPIGWESGTTIQYYLDPGSLGRLTNEQAHTLLKEAMKIWEDASPEADVPRFEFAGYLSEDVNGTNYQTYVSLGSCYADDLASCPSEAQKNLQTVIIFDEDDSILDNELCRITSCAAAAGARTFSGSPVDPRNIIQGIFVLGSSSGLTSTKIKAVVGTMVHELGHLLGLAHTSVNQEADIADMEELDRYLPTMFTSSKIVALENVSIRQSTPTPDDIAGISVLYPSDGFSTETATIKGQILKSDNSPMIHVNVIARNIDDPLCEAYSYLSGRLCEAASSTGCESSSTPSDRDSSYEISDLPPGSYTLEVEEVADESLAMTLAPGLVDPFIYGDAEFWNEGDAAGDPSNLTFSTITLAAGETRENVDIILNRSEVTDDRVKYIPLDTFTPGPGTRCPEEPPVDYAEMIGIDEGGDSDDGDSTSPSGGGCSLIGTSE